MSQTTRAQCPYGFWCKVCNEGFVSLTWEEKESIKAKHNHKENKE